MLSSQEIFNVLSKCGCIALYKTGSSCIPFIKYPRDVEYIAVYDTIEHAANARRMLNVIPIYKGFKYSLSYFSYQFHYINKCTDFIGQKYVFDEFDINDVVEYLTEYFKAFRFKYCGKRFYHYAIVKAIQKYGYDNIPEDVIDEINRLHDASN